MWTLSGAAARTATIICVLTLSACASGGGGGGGFGTGPGGGSVGAPAAATPGANPAPSQQASPGGSGLPYPPDGTFPLTQSAIRATQDTASADTNVMSGGATITINAASVTLKIPALGIDTVITGNGTPVTSNGYSVYLAIGGGDWYFGGLWGAETSTTAFLSHFIGGYETPAGRVPSSGRAVFDHEAIVVGTLYTPTNVYVLNGTAVLNADFASGAVTGQLFAFSKTDLNLSTQSWEGTVTINAQIASGTNKVNGSTGFIPGETFTSSASGNFNGGFYGPDANELAAVWTLSDGTNAAVGVVGAETRVPGGTAAISNLLYGAAEVQNDYFYPNELNSTFGRPAPASTGNNPAPALLASPGGPTLDGSGSPPPTSTEFPLTFTSMKYSANALVADTAANSGGATLIGNRLLVPGAGIDTHISVGVPYNFGNGGGGGSASVGQSIDISMFGLSYVAFGVWMHYANSTPHNAGAFVFGYETPVASMPTTGTATYARVGGVIGSVLVYNAQPQYGAAVGGDVSLTANFASGTVTGSFTNMRAFDKFTLTPWNDVSVSAVIAGSRVNGNTAVTFGLPYNQAPFGLGSNATGEINGGFYGPSAENFGAVWSLSDGNRSAIGWVGAPRQ